MTNNQNNLDMFKDSFFCNKCYDISFSEFHKLIKLCLPTNYESIETRGIYRANYQPCNIIEIREKNNIDSEVICIWCWFGKKGLTILADNEFTVSLCIEILKHIKRNPEELKIEKLPAIDEQVFLDKVSTDYRIFEQLKTDKPFKTYLIQEPVGDQVLITFYPDLTSFYGNDSSLYSYVLTLVEQISKQK